MSNHENFQIQIHSRLNEESIKLWLEPYFKDSEANLDAIHVCFLNISQDSKLFIAFLCFQSLAARFSDDLKIPLESCQATLLELQCHAIKKLSAKKMFEETGLAFFALKVCKSQSPPQNNKSVSCQLDQLGSVLVDAICKELSESDGSNMKVICAGKVLNISQTLREQGEY